MKKNISRNMAEEIVLFAKKHSALVESKEFTNYDRHVISTPEGTVALKAPKDDELKVCTLENFHGFDHKLIEINERGMINIKGYQYI